jgi:hypothetical protein
MVFLFDSSAFALGAIIALANAIQETVVIILNRFIFIFSFCGTALRLENDLAQISRRAGSTLSAKAFRGPSAVAAPETDGAGFIWPNMMLRFEGQSQNP